MRASRHGFLLLVIAAAASLMLIGCAPCEFAVCPAPFVWESSLANDELLPAGVYEVHIEADGHELVVAALVNEEASVQSWSRDGESAEPRERFELGDDRFLEIRIGAGPWVSPEGLQGGAPTGVTGFHTEVMLYTRDDRPELAGPASVRVRVFGDVGLLADELYEPEYVRDNGFFGGDPETCGFCDAQVVEKSVLGP